MLDIIGKIKSLFRPKTNKNEDATGQQTEREAEQEPEEQDRFSEKAASGRKFKD